MSTKLSSSLRELFHLKQDAYYRTIWFRASYVNSSTMRSIQIESIIAEFKGDLKKIVAISLK